MKEYCKFKNPNNKYLPKKMVHNKLDGDVDYYPSGMEDKTLAWDTDRIINAILEQGYSGAVINPSGKNGFTSNNDNLERFKKVIDKLDERGMPFWIYDEVGYPSGQAGGLTLEGHPEFLAKGLFMYKRFALEPVHAKYHLPDEADKIVYAAKYKFGDALAKGRVDYNTAEPIEFDSDYLECDLGDHEALFVFSVKTAHDGTPGMHNNFSQNYNINIMDEKAVRRFIDVAYEPIAAAIPDAYSRCENVFTDEPSLFCQYVAADETWNYAMAPWVDGLFDEYRKEYGESLEPSLPLIFEGGVKSYPTRVKFYELVGKLIARAYSGQLAKWCEAHGCGFSGHYLGEGNINHNVSFYGNYVRVLLEASYPGGDILRCYPEVYQFLNERVTQIAVRRKNSNGMMMEICPFSGKEEFDKHPYDNIKCITALCFRSGVRCVNSYFSIPLDSPDNPKMKDYNEYTARLGYMLDGLKNDTDIFVYYPIEDAQAKYRPLHCCGWNGGDQSTKAEIEALTDALDYGGYDYYLADFDDIRDAVGATISGIGVKTLLVPKMDTIRKSTLDGIRKLIGEGVNVIFVGGLPTVDAESGDVLDTSGLCAVGIDEALRATVYNFAIVSDKDEMLIKAKFKDGDRMVYMLVNMERHGVTATFDADKDARLYIPDSGDVEVLEAGESFTVPACRAVFVVA